MNIFWNLNAYISVFLIIKILEVKAAAYEF